MTLQFSLNSLAMSFPSSGFSCCNSHFGNTNQQGLDTIHPGSFKILQILKYHFHNVMNEGNPRLTAKRVWVSPSCLPLLLASPSRFQSADEIISQKRIISSAVNESQPSAAMTAARKKSSCSWLELRFALSERRHHASP